MNSIQHLSPEEQQHYIPCDCGEYMDMRDLSEVVKHLHTNFPEAQWSYSVKKDEPVAFLKSGKKVGLN